MFTLGLLFVFSLPFRRSEKSSIDVIPGQSGVATNENTTKSESSISSRQVVDPV